MGAVMARSITLAFAIGKSLQGGLCPGASVERTLFDTRTLPAPLPPLRE